MNWDFCSLFLLFFFYSLWLIVTRYQFIFLPPHSWIFSCTWKIYIGPWDKFFPSFSFPFSPCSSLCQKNTHTFFSALNAARERERLWMIFLCIVILRFLIIFYVIFSLHMRVSDTIFFFTVNLFVTYHNTFILAIMKTLFSFSREKILWRWLKSTSYTNEI